MAKHLVLIESKTPQLIFKPNLNYDQGLSKRTALTTNKYLVIITRQAFLLQQCFKLLFAITLCRQLLTYRFDFFQNEENIIELQEDW